MKWSTRSPMILAIAASAALAGCSSGFTNVAPEPPPQHTRLGKATGTACGSLGLLATAYYFVPMGINSRVERAYGEALAVLVFAAERGIVSRLLLTRPLAGLGTISYSLYLVHSQVETAVTQAIARGAGLLGLGGSFVSAPGSNRPALTGPYADLAALVAVLAAVAAAIAGTETNIDHVELEERDAETSVLVFECKVHDRRHLARILRVIRRMPEVLAVKRTIAIRKGED